MWRGKSYQKFWHNGYSPGSIEGVGLLCRRIGESPTQSSGIVELKSVGRNRKQPPVCCSDIGRRLRDLAINKRFGQECSAGIGVFSKTFGISMSSHQTGFHSSKQAKQTHPRGRTALHVWGYRAMVCIWIFAALIRISVRDLSPFSLFTMLYYALPGVLLCLFAALLMFTAGVLRRYQSAAAWGIMAVIIVQCAGSHRMFPVQGTDVGQSHRSYRLLLWNVCHGLRGWEPVAAEIHKHHADIIALVEAGPPSEKMRSFWKKEFPGYDISLLGGEMVFLTRGESTAVRAKNIGREGRLREVDLILDGHVMTSMVVDIHGRPSVPRGESIEDLSVRIKSQQGRPVLIAGDFNTPSESPLFQFMHQQASNAFEVAGEGYSPTWPCPYPVLVIDQIWGNQQIAFDSCRNIRSKSSDHCAILTEFHFIP